MDEEKDNKFPFLDALVEQRSFAFVTSIYRKSTLTCLYLSWDAIAPKSRNVNLIKCLTFRVLKICSHNKIISKIVQIENLFLDNKYLEEVIVGTINKTVYKFRNTIRPLGPSKCPVNVRFPWTGSPSQLIGDKVSSSATRCYDAAIIPTIFTTRATFHFVYKDLLPTFQQSNLIYKFQCSRNVPRFWGYSQTTCSKRFP